MKNRIIKIICVMLLFLFCFYRLAVVFSPGTAPFAEVYDVDMKESILIEKMLFLKRDRIQYRVPKEVGLEDRYLVEHSTDFLIYFYYKPENQIILVKVEPSIEDSTSKIKFIGINQGLTLGNWKTINDDYGFWESNREKAKFEERILKPLNINYVKDEFW